MKKVSHLQSYRTGITVDSCNIFAIFFEIFLSDDLITSVQGRSGFSEANPVFLAIFFLCGGLNFFIYQIFHISTWEGAGDPLEAGSLAQLTTGVPSGDTISM